MLYNRYTHKNVLKYKIHFNQDTRYIISKIKEKYNYKILKEISFCQILKYKQILSKNIKRLI